MKKLVTIISIAAFIGSAVAQEKQMQFYRPADQHGVNVFEPSKRDTVDFNGMYVKLGGNFALQYQDIKHSNTALPKLNADGKNLNKLLEIGGGFNLATANMNIDAQLDDGISLSLVTYLSSRNHAETWVKGGYLQFDKLPFLKSAFADRIMENVRIKVGHMEINYGDAHFRRTDNGNAFHNPFVGNYIMDAFTTEIGGEVYYMNNGIIVMGGLTGGEIKGDITKPDKRKPTILGKIGYDNYVMDNLRLRLTGSIYHTDASVSNTLYGGDRGGSRYYAVMENILASSTAPAFSGRFNPGFRDKVTAWVVNPFIKFHGLEIFANYEQAEGRAAEELSTRKWESMGGELLYRFGGREQFYVGGRYQMVSGELVNYKENPEITRMQIAGGWYVTKNILAKLEYVTQEYNGFAPTDIKNGGKFDGIMIEGAIAF
ncbi:MAG: hypothetical protein ACR2GN_08140 [Bacteroidia bacterium]